MLADIVFWFLVFGWGALLWIRRYRKLYVEHILLALADAAAPLVVGYVIFSVVGMLLVSYHEITGKVGEAFFSNPAVVLAYSMTANWFLYAVLMATQARALEFFAKAFAKNTLVYPKKIFWGCLLLAAPLILLACALVSGFALFSAIANQDFRMWVLPQVFIANEDPHPVTQCIGVEMFSLLVVSVIAFLVCRIYRERSFEKFVSMVVMVHAGIYTMLALAFLWTFLAGLYMLAHSPQDTLTSIFREILNGYALTIVLLGLGTYGLRTLGLFLISHSIRRENSIGTIVGAVIVALTSFLI